MSKKSKPKFYVVWEGVQPGIYTTWEEASRMVSGYGGAKYKSFDTRAAAEEAYRGAYSNYAGKPNAPKPAASDLAALGVRLDGMAVDAACAGVPGPMEYRGVWLNGGEQVFHAGPFEDGTNNVGEFLAIVHAAGILKRDGRTGVPIYSDSRNAIGWVKQRECRTKLEATGRNRRIFELIDRAVAWLRNNEIENPILKWETEHWGENPADFGRK